jgi:mercuric ion transport protein
VFASAVALVCCAGVAPALGLVSAIGLGFLLKDAVLIPLLVVALAVTAWGLRQGRRCHGRNGPLALGLLASVITVAGLFISVPLAIVGFGALLVSSVWNILAVRACPVNPGVSPRAPTV